MNRCGTQPGAPTVALAKEIHSRKGLEVRGTDGLGGSRPPDQGRRREARDGRGGRARSCSTRRASAATPTCRSTSSRAAGPAPTRSRRPSTASPRSRPAAASTATWSTATRSGSIIRWRCRCWRRSSAARPRPASSPTPGFKSLSTQNMLPQPKGIEQREPGADVGRARHDGPGRRRTPTSRSATRSSGTSATPTRRWCSTRRCTASATASSRWSGRSSGAASSSRRQESGDRRGERDAGLVTVSRWTTSPPAPSPVLCLLTPVARRERPASGRGAYRVGGAARAGPGGRRGVAREPGRLGRRPSRAASRRASPRDWWRRTAGGSSSRPSAPTPNRDAPRFHRREARIAAALPAGAPVPRLLWSYDEGGDGWVVLVFEDVEGRHPAVPWQPDELDRVLEALDALAESLTPSPVSEDVAGPVEHWLAAARAGLEAAAGRPAARP